MSACCEKSQISNTKSGGHSDTHENVAIGAKDSNCCDDGGCECDDGCLDQLARAICADDCTHLHYNDTSPVQDSEAIPEDTDDCTSCCAGGGVSSEANTVIDEQHKGADACCSATSKDVGTREDSCTHGLRKRVGRNVGRSRSQDRLPSEACGEHKSIARSRYRDTLAAFGCVCKALLAHGLQSCCTTKTTPSIKSRSTSRHVHLQPARHSSSIISTKRHPSADSCCDDSCCGGSKRSPSVKSKEHGTRLSIDSSCRDSCCSGVKEPRSRLSIDSCCNDGCCDNSEKKKDVDLGGIEVAALENGVGTPDQHAVLAIKGMTCTGCENQLIRAMQAIPAICNLKTSLVLCRAEFDYDGNAMDLQSLIQAIERRTGFSAEVVAAVSTRELRLTINKVRHAEFAAISRPDGVESIAKIDKDTLSVTYDPKTIGARKVLEYYAAFSPILAAESRDPALTAGTKQIRLLAFRTALSAMLTIPVLVMAWVPLPSHPRAYAIASLVLATLVQTVITGPVYSSAFKSLFFSHLVETDLLVVLSTTTAYVYSVVAFAFAISGHALEVGEFFETSTLLVTLITLGQLVSAFARQRAMEAISIRSLQQNVTTLVHADGGEETIDVRLLHYSDVFRVAPDSSIITDGIVRVGQSEVDESMMTGESQPVTKVPGDAVVAGTANGSGTLFVEVERLPGENTISDIAAMVDDARFSRARVQATVDRVCGWFVPVVLGLAVVTFAVWLAVGVAVRGQAGGDAVVAALTYAIAVLAISCPCAVGLAIPMVILVAGGVAAKLGLVFKAATTIESARKITHVVFDKTGTLTQGRLTVVSSEVFETPDIEVHAAIIGLVADSKHPVARAVATHVLNAAIEKGGAQVEKIEMVTGKGMQAIVSGGILRGGSPFWLEVADHPAVESLLTKGLTVFCVTYDGRLIAAFGLEDTLRLEASSVVNALRQRDIRVSILSGDHAAAVDKVASSLGVPSESVRASCLPVDKQAYIKELMRRGEKVLFCGDGTNDAVALAQADIGVHLQSDSGAGAGVAASAAADVVLLHPSLTGILVLFSLSEAVQRRIVLNFAWSAVYNVVAILFAAGAFVRARITPAYAGLGEVVSVLPVVLVALQLRWFKWKA